MEVLLRRCRPPQPPAAVERRVVEEAARLRRPPSRLLVLAASLLFAAVVVAVLRVDPPVRPASGRGTIRQWSYVHLDQGKVVARLSAEEADVVDGVARLRAFTATLFPAKGEGTMIRSDTARVDLKESRITAEGGVRIDRVDGFSSAVLDLRSKDWIATMDLADRFAKAASSTPENYRPQRRIDAASATSWDSGSSFVDGSLQLICPGWTFIVSGPRGRSDRETFTFTGGVKATFEDGTSLPVEEALLGNSERKLSLKGTFK